MKKIKNDYDKIIILCVSLVFLHLRNKLTKLSLFCCSFYDRINGNECDPDESYFHVVINNTFDFWYLSFILWVSFIFRDFVWLYRYCCCNILMFFTFFFSLSACYSFVFFFFIFHFVNIFYLDFIVDHSLYEQKKLRCFLFTKVKYL